METMNESKQPPLLIQMKMDQKPTETGIYYVELFYNDVPEKIFKDTIEYDAELGRWLTVDEDITLVKWFSEQPQPPADLEKAAEDFMKSICQALGYHDQTSLNVAMITEEILATHILEEVKKQFAVASGNNHIPDVGNKVNIEQLFPDQITIESIFDVLIQNKSDESDEGSWIISQDFWKIAGLIYEEIKSIQSLPPKDNNEAVDPVELLKWLTDEKSKYAVLYGGLNERFACNDREYTINEVIEIFKQEQNKKG